MTDEADGEARVIGSELTREQFLRRAAVVGLTAGAAGTFTNVANAIGGATPKRGGTVLMGTTGGSAKDGLDAHCPVCTKPDEARLVQLFEPLAKYDEKFRIRNWLAEEITPTNASVWTIRVRSGVEFHDGKPLTADDVIFSLRRIIDPKVPTQGKSGLGSLDPNGMKKLDSRTVRLTLKEPDATLPDALAQYYNTIVPVGYDPAKPIGTGPFKADTFTPGQRSTFVRNPNYWRHGLPYIDGLTIIDFTDDTALVNALLGSQVHAIKNVPYGQIPAIKSNPKLRILESPSGQWLPFTMRLDTPPFNDNDVRQAFRWVVDRPQMIAQALAGHGRVGNDIFSPFDPSYDHSLPQRHQDIEKAKSLLKKAGKENLSVDLQTSDVAAGLVQAAQVFAEQAKKAGITVNVKKIDPSVFWGPEYPNWTFAGDFFNSRNYLPQCSQNMLPTAPFNETKWKDAQWNALYKQAKATVDAKKRADIIHSMQRIEWDRGGLIIWSFNNIVDAYSAKIAGLKPDASLALNRYGFEHVWFV
jgi:peptide/nickel transport system substrate-binding protein